MRRALAPSLLLTLCLLVSEPVWAEAPRTSPIPPPRPFVFVAPVVPVLPVITGQRPKPRPAGLVAVAPLAPQAQPRQQPQQQQAAQPQQRVSAKGSVCGNPNIKGAALKPIRSKIKACNVAEPVLVSSINGVKLVPAATINCNEAQALSVWIGGPLQQVYQNQVVALRIADSYSCRPRNNVRGAKISEHGKGNAIDIEAFVLASGKVLTVARNFNKQMRAAYKAACGTFHTTLGPGSDGYHENHLHLDVAAYRGRPYCR